MMNESINLEKVFAKIKNLSEFDQIKVAEYVELLENYLINYPDKNQRLMQIMDDIAEIKTQNLDKIQIHRPTGNNVYGMIYMTEVTENLLKTIAKAFKITEQDIYLKVSNFNQEKSLRGGSKNIEFIVEKAGEILLFNGGFTGSETRIYELLSQLFLDVAQKNIQSQFDFFDENHDLSFTIP